jgi:D-3-phosphoglycerate dehydrogenase
MGRVLVTEKLAETGLDLLREAGHEVDVQLGLSDDELKAAIVGAHGLIIRSATQVTADLLGAADRLLVVGRAGVGLDNVDTEAATERGVIVANAPTSNSISAAEHTMALILAAARNVPQAHSALKVGRWERVDWKGVELNEKTLGIVGLGNIGGLVAARARAFGMRLVGHDPFVSEERAAELGVELLELDDLVAQADFLTLHLARTPETMNLIDEKRLQLAKPDLRVVNVARGGIVNEQDLANAIRRGVIAGAAIDVFDSEPKTESPLFGLDQVVVTPHLGASTAEAQDRAGVTTAEQVLHALAGDFVPFAVNVAARGVSEAVRPFLPVAEQIGARFARLLDRTPGAVDVVFAGEIGGYDCRMAELALTKGLMSEIADGPVSYVNAEELAEDAGIKIAFRTSTNSPSGFISGVKIEGESHSMAGTILVPSGEMRIISVDDITVDIPPADHLTLVANTDQPGMIGIVAAALGDAGINIDDMHIGHAPGADMALMVIATRQAISPELAASIEAQDGITSVRSLDLTSN